MKFSLFLFFTLIHIATSFENFGTKTAYNASLKIDEEEKFFKPYPSENVCEDAELLYITGLFRHGTRYPGKKKILKVSETLKNLKTLGRQGKELLAQIKQVLVELDSHQDMNLSYVGFEELQELGSKMKLDHASIFDGYKHENFRYYVTSKERTISSFKAFFKGLEVSKKEPESINADPILRFFDFCDKYNKEVIKNKTSLEEYYKFMMSKLEYLNSQMLQKYSKFFQAVNFTPDEIFSLYMMAGVEVAVLKTRRIADTFFSTSSSLTMEYAIDLLNFWKRSGGHEISVKMSCVLLKDIFKHFHQLIKDQSQLRGSFYFAHAETYMPFFYLVGLFNDTLTSSTFTLYRTFKTTNIMPFAGNLVIEVLNCTGVPHLRLSIKGHPLAWPSCQQPTCSYNHLLHHYNAIMQRCNFDGMCHNIHHLEL